MWQWPIAITAGSLLITLTYDGRFTVRRNFVASAVFVDERNYERCNTGIDRTT